MRNGHSLQMCYAMQSVCTLHSSLVCVIEHWCALSEFTAHKKRSSANQELFELALLQQNYLTVYADTCPGMTPYITPMTVISGTNQMP
jgi:hypothetical protein